MGKIKVVRWSAQLGDNHQEESGTPAGLGCMTRHGKQCVRLLSLQWERGSMQYLKRGIP